MTTQAFDEMQEQNARLLKQLQEKEDANLKLMSEVRCIARGHALEGRKTTFVRRE